jgi:long-chain acyl-CoA synthetase
MNNLTEWIMNEVIEPQRTALSTQSGDYSYQDILDESNKIAELLQPFGPLNGKKIGMLVPAVFSFVAISLAINRLGGIIVPISHHFRKDDITTLLTFLDPHLIFTIESCNGFDCKAVVDQWAASCSKDTVIISAPDHNQWATKIYHGTEERPRLLDKAHIISCSSGSTGLPKGIMVTTEWFVHNQSALPLILDFNPEDRLLSMVPCASNFGMSLIFVSLLKGVHITVTENYDFPSIVTLMEKQACNKLVTTPSLYKALTIFVTSMNSEVLEHLILCGLGGENINEGFVDGLASWPQCSFRSIYGLSELAALFYTEKDLRQGLELTVVPGVRFKILNQQVKGEIAFQVESGFVGYYQNPNLTHEFLRDGWFYSGDEVVICGPNQIRIVGRMKDVIKKGGAQIMPGEIEQLLLQHPKIKQAAVVGAPHRVFGEQIVAFIPKTTELNEQELYQYMKEKTAAYKIPDKVIWLDSLPIAQGKLDKITLRKLAENYLGGA